MPHPATNSTAPNPSSSHPHSVWHAVPLLLSSPSYPAVWQDGHRNTDCRRWSTMNLAIHVSVLELSCSFLRILSLWIAGIQDRRQCWGFDCHRGLQWWIWWLCHRWVLCWSVFRVQVFVNRSESIKSGIWTKNCDKQKLYKLCGGQFESMSLSLRIAKVDKTFKNTKNAIGWFESP